MAQGITLCSRWINLYHLVAMVLRDPIMFLSSPNDSKNANSQKNTKKQNEELMKKTQRKNFKQTILYRDLPQRS
jgi:hypothetical protein